MLTCRELVQHQASDYLDNQLGISRRLGFRLHLLLCDNCRRFMRQLRHVRQVLARQAEPVDEAIVQSLAAQLHQLQQAESAQKNK